MTGPRKDWRVVPLGELTNPKSRRRVKPQDYPDLDYVGMQNVESETMRLLGTVPASTMKSSAVHFQPGDVLYGRLRPYLNKVWLADFEGLGSPEFIVMPPSEEVHGRYLQYFLNHSGFVRFATSLNTGDRPRVDFNQLKAFPVHLAPYEQQLAIVEEIEKQFTRLAAAVGALHRVREKLRRYIVSILEAGISGRMFPNNDLRSAKLKDVSEIQLGRQRSPKNHTGPNMVHYLRAANVTWEGLDLRDVMQMNFSSAEVERFKLQRGDLLVAEASGSQFSVGKAAIWNDELPECCIQNTLIRVRPFDALPEYLLLVFQHASTTGAFGRAARGVGIHHLGARTLMEWSVELPDIETQRAVAAAVSERVREVSRIRIEVDLDLKRAAVVRNSILAKAFSGGILSSAKGAGGDV